MRHHLCLDSNHTSSIPAAGSTFAAFELTRGEYGTPLVDKRVIDIPLQNICENLLVYEILVLRTAPAKISHCDCRASRYGRHVRVSSLPPYVCTARAQLLCYPPSRYVVRFLSVRLIFIEIALARTGNDEVLMLKQKKTIS